MEDIACFGCKNILCSDKEYNRCYTCNTYYCNNCGNTYYCDKCGNTYYCNNCGDKIWLWHDTNVCNKCTLRSQVLKN